MLGYKIGAKKWSDKVGQYNELDFFWMQRKYPLNRVKEVHF